MPQADVAGDAGAQKPLDSIETGRNYITDDDFGRKIASTAAPNGTQRGAVDRIKLAQIEDAIDTLLAQ